MLNPKYYQIGPKKLLTSSKTQLHTLMTDVQRSRMAVDNIKTFRSTQIKIKQQIQHLQIQLQNWINNINIQTKRHNILNQLVQLLQIQIDKYQHIKKKQQQQQQTKHNKLISKYQYQIDQILQKHNEQIAKMHNLKQIANSRRSQRVVYSNLFKKLQKQLKHYQQIYKQKLLITQCSIPRTCQFVRYDYKPPNPPKQHTQQDDKKTLAQQLVKKNYQRRYTDSPNPTPPNQPAWNGYLTSNKQDYMSKFSKNSTHKKKFHQTNDLNQKSQLKTTRNIQQKLYYTRDLIQKISQFNNSIDKIKVYAQCSNTQDILQHYSDIYTDNQKLVTQIKDFDQKIDQLSSSKIHLTKLIAQQQFGNEQSQTSSFPTQPKPSPLIKPDNKNLSTQQHESQKHLRQIGQSLGIWLQSQQSMLQKKQFLTLLDQKLSIFSNQLLKIYPDINKRQDTILSQTIVDCLLEKMDKYQNCQKILDQHLFRQEYYKQLTKRRPNRSRKDTSK